MKNGLDLINDIRSLLNVSAVTSEISGKIWPNERPDNRLDKADIVVNSLAISNNQLQRGIGNVNIYVPTISTVIDGKPQQTPDYSKLNRLIGIVLPLLDDIWKETFHTEVEEPGTLLKDTDGSFFYNIKVKYYHLRESNFSL